LDERKGKEEDGADFAQAVAGGDVARIGAGAVDRGDDPDCNGGHESHPERMRVAQRVEGE
jgi:hypothetical protein